MNRDHIEVKLMEELYTNCQVSFYTLQQNYTWCFHYILVEMNSFYEKKKLHHVSSEFGG